MYRICLSSHSPGAERIGQHVFDLTKWYNFYVIVGSSAGALIGLQFVVLTLIAERPSMRTPELGAAFATPSVVHFVIVLFLSAVISAPWNGIGVVSVVWGLIGVAGIIYAVVIARRMKGQKIYKTVFEDWLFHVVLPIIAYGLLLASAALGYAYVESAPFFVAAATLLLLFVGIHNAWDAVTYHVFVLRGKTPEEKNSDR